PRLVVRGATVAVVPGRAGTTPQGNRLLAAVERQVLAGKRVVRLFFRPAAAAITPAAAAAAAWRARLVVSAPVTVTYHGASLTTLPPERLARFLRIRPRATAIDVSLDTAGL